MASYQQATRTLNLAAGSDLSSSQYKAVVLSSDGAVDVAGAAAEAIGFLMNAPTTGDIAEIASNGGGGKAIAGGTITAGDILATDANGDVVTATANQVGVARALESAVDNDIFNVEVLTVFSGTATV